MAVSFLKKAKSLSPTKSPKYLLHQHLHAPHPGRSMKNVHASSLTKPEGFCPRYVALHDVLNAKAADEWLTTSETITYDMGHDFQDRVVNHFADMGRAVGHWRCHGCAKLYQFCKRPQKCECGCKGFKPEEVRFVSAVNGASCGIDMLLDLPSVPKLTPIEIKTMDKEQFKGLAAPLSEHRVRTQLYLRIIAESDQSWANLVDTQKAWILYGSKGGYGCADPGLKAWGLSESFSPFKEWVITRNDASTDEFAKRAKVVKDFREGNIGMPCGICSTAMVKRAQYCPMKKPCWSGDHPPEHDWQTL